MGTNTEKFVLAQNRTCNDQSYTHIFLNKTYIKNIIFKSREIEVLE